MCSRTQKLTVVLASASPRRTELLEQGNIKHVVMPSHCEEVITSQVPSQVVEELSVQKAEDVYQQYETKNTGDFLVIGSDTVVAADGKILGKPKDKEEAYQMIKQVADYLARTEPHSPVPYLLQRAYIWGHTPLPELLNELITGDESARRLWRQLGVLP